MEYLWALNYLFYGVYLWALNYLFYGVPLGSVRVLVGEGLERRGGHQVAVLHQGGDLSVPGHTYINQSIHFFVMRNMNFTIGSNLDSKLF